MPTFGIFRSPETEKVLAHAATKLNKNMLACPLFSLLSCWSIVIKNTCLVLFLDASCRLWLWALPLWSQLPRRWHFLSHLKDRKKYIESSWDFLRCAVDVLEKWIAIPLRSIVIASYCERKSIHIPVCATWSCFDMEWRLPGAKRDISWSSGGFIA